MTITTTERDCEHCGQTITVTSRNPNRRFCSTRCRRTDWTARQRAVRTNSVSNGDVVRGNGVAGDGVGGNGVDVPDAPRPSTITRCPHCHQQVTVLTWLLPPTAAHVTTPDHG